MIENASKELFSFIALKAQAFEPVAEAFARTRFMVAAIEYGDNEKEYDSLERISDAFQCHVTQTEDGVRLTFDADNGDKGNYLDIIEEGMLAPVSGGSNGLVTNPDGSISRSLVPEQLQGTPLPWYEEPASDVMNELKIMLSDLFSDFTNNLVNEYKREIENIMKRYVAEEIRDAFRK